MPAVLCIFTIWVKPYCPGFHISVHNLRRVKSGQLRMATVSTWPTPAAAANPVSGDNRPDI